MNLEQDVRTEAAIMLKTLKIADIKIGKRHRKDMGDLTSLADGKPGNNSRRQLQHQDQGGTANDS